MLVVSFVILMKEAVSPFHLSEVTKGGDKRSLVFSPLITDFQINDFDWTLLRNEAFIKNLSAIRVLKVSVINFLYLCMRSNKNALLKFIRKAYASSLFVQSKNIV